jgi:glycosyltransferase involved in cell wall biosynthesis
MPRISVILPVHNRADVLPRAIQSVVEQELQDFELIVIDDGSTDDSAQVVESFGDERIQLIKLGTNRGPSAARNVGIQASRAPLLGFLDSDDSYLPNKLAQVVAEFERRPELDLLVDSFMKVQESGKRLLRRNRPTRDPQQFRRALFTRRLWKATPAITVRRETIVRAGLFDESLRWLEDFDLLIRISDFASCAASDAVLWTKHWDADAISGGEDMVAANVELVRRHPDYLTVREYRPGLVYILRLALWRRLKRRDVAGAGRDIRRLAEGLGGFAAARLLAGTLLPRRSAQ